MTTQFHLAGEPVGLKQACIRCGATLVDFRSDTVAERVTEARPMFFASHRLVEVTAGGLKTTDGTLADERVRDGLCSLTRRNAWRS